VWAVWGMERCRSCGRQLILDCSLCVKMHALVRWPQRPSEMFKRQPGALLVGGTGTRRAAGHAAAVPHQQAPLAAANPRLGARLFTIRNVQPQ